MRYLSLFSGIEAASVAWDPLGWTPVGFAEIDPFPSAVLKHHYPDVPNFGDVTKFKEWPDVAVDLVCGGSPCQSFSIAGLRKGMDDPRGNMALVYLAIVNKYQPRWVVFENVPGIFSSTTDDIPDPRPPEVDLDSDDGPEDGQEIVVEDEHDGNESHALGCFLAGLQELGYGFSYRVLDAQFCRVDGFPRAVPQRRRRVFVVGYLGDWRRAAAVLSEPESVLGNSPPRRQAGQGTAAPAARSVAIRGRDGTPQAELGDDVANAILTPNGGRAGVGVGAVLTAGVAPTLRAGGNQTGGDRPYGTDVDTCDSLIAFNSREDPETTWDRSGPLGSSSPQAQAIAYSIMPQNSGKDYKARQVDVAQPIMAGGPVGGNQGGDYLLQPIPIDMRQASRGETMTNNRPEGTSGGAPGTGIGEIGDPSPTIASSHVPAVAFAQNSRDEVRLQDGDGQIVGALAAEPGMKQTTYVQQGWAVRRLTPTECEALQGFPRNYTDVPYRNKPAADGPRYKALGNSMAVNCMRWIGRRIEMVEQIAADIDKEAAA